MSDAAAFVIRLLLPVNCPKVCKKTMPGILREEHLRDVCVLRFEKAREYQMRRRLKEKRFQPGICADAQSSPLIKKPLKRRNERKDEYKKRT